ncbi:hypothetical protein Tco_1286089 [Tanacetum coccineum]
MASMKYCDKHNQVGFLKKPEESTRFAEIVDFLKDSHIRYALTHNLTIHDSLVKQFWQTTTASTLADGTLELRATIDTIEYTITEASVRSKLHLADASGIFMIYNFSKLIFDGMVANLKSKTKFLMYPRFLQMILEIQTKNKHPYLAIALTKKIFRNMKMGFRGVPRPLLPAMLPVVAVDQSAGQPDQAVDQPSSSAPLPSLSHPHVLSATIESEPTPVTDPTPHPTSPSPDPDSEPIEHTFEQPSPEHQPLSPRQEIEVPQSQKPVAEERTMSVDDLLQLVPKLLTKVDSLETELQQTKLTMGKALVKLVKKVKKMEDVLKRRHVVLPDSEDEDADISSKQGRNLQEEGLDEMVRNMMKDKSEVFKTPTQSKTSGEEDISPTTLEAAKTLSKVASQRTKSVDKGKRYKRRKESKGKDISTGLEDISTGLEDISTGFEEVNTGGLGVSTGSRPKPPRIDKPIEEEETAKQVHLDALLAKRLAEEEELTEQQKQRKAQELTKSCAREKSCRWMNFDKEDGSRFSKTDNFKGVPHPLTGDYTPKPQEEIDDSLYVYGKKGPQKPETSDSDDKFSENSVTSSKEVVSEPKPKEAEPSCVTHVKTHRQPMKNQGTPKVKGKNWNEMMERELGEGYSFIKKKCFVCRSLSHLIKDCDFYEKKMAREGELKKQRVINTGNGVAKPVWNNANRINRANHFVPRPVQLYAVRSNVNTVRANVNSVRQNVNSVKTNINIVRSKRPVPINNTNSFSPGTAVKTSAGYNWRKTRPNSNYNSGSKFVRTVNSKGPQGRPKPEKAWVPKRN